MGRTPPGQTRKRVFHFVRQRILAGSPPTVREVQEKAPESEKVEVERLSEEGTSGKPQVQAEEREVDSEPAEAQLTARQWFEKGRALDDDSEAEMQFYQRAIEVDPKFAPAYYQRGAIFYRQANYDLAEQEFVSFLQYATEEDRAEYNIYLYYSGAEIERLLAEGRQAQEEESKEKSAEVEEEQGEEGGPESTAVAEEAVQTIVRFSAANGHMVVPVVLNDFVEASLLLDTGAGITIVSMDLARHLGFQLRSADYVRLKTIAADVKAPLRRLNSIRVGELSRKDVPVAVADLSLVGEGKFDGILGMDFLSHYALHIDSERSTITLSPRN